MINETTIASHAYAVTSPVRGAVTDCHGNTIISVKAGEQSIFIAPGPIAMIPDGASIVPIASDTKLSVNIGGGGSSLNVEVVNVLPDVGEPGIIYFVPITGEIGDNTYEEWTWLTEKNGWESLGTATIDLSNYAVLDGNNTYTGDNTYTGVQTYNGNIIVNGGLSAGETSGEIEVNGNIIVNGGLSASEINGEIEVAVEAPALTISHGTWFNNTTQDTIEISPATWNNAIKTCYIKSSIPVTLTGVTRIDDNPMMETGKIYVFALQQIDATTIIANMAYSITV